VVETGAPSRAHPVVEIRALRFDRFVVLGDDALAASAEQGPGAADLLAARLGVQAWNLAEEGASARQVLREQLPLALALRPSFAVVSVGTSEALATLAAAASGDGSFLAPLLADCEEIVARLRAAGCDVLLVRPPSLDRSPAAWLRYGRHRPANTVSALDAALRGMERVAGRWYAALERVAAKHGVLLADLSHVYDARLECGSPLDGAAPGLPPNCGGAGDLFSDPVRLSLDGIRVAAELLEAALHPARWSRQQRAQDVLARRTHLSPSKGISC
jgi:hypothetical protein